MDAHWTPAAIPDGSLPARKNDCQGFLRESAAGHNLLLAAPVLWRLGYLYDAGSKPDEATKRRKEVDGARAREPNPDAKERGAGAGVPAEACDGPRRRYNEWTGCGNALDLLNCRLSLSSEVSMSKPLRNRVRVVKGDITRLDVDVIVNAANSSLLGGGGVDGAVHRAAGPGLLEECRALGGCPSGQARLTGGHRLLAKHVVHAVGPVYETGREGEAELLRSCYEAALRLAAEQGAWTVAFPCISTGAFGYPKDEACRIAADVVLAWLRAHELPRQVTFCCYEAEDARLYRERLADVLATGES
jgi:O-acetyl-ADP-ribose deacetylase (regulator of RNase III)